MKMRILLVPVMFLLLLSCVAEKTPQYVPKQYGSGTRAAVWDLEDHSVTNNPQLADMQEFLTAKVHETLGVQGGFELVEREKLLLALEELSIGSSELAAEDSRLQLGKILGAQVMVFGGYQLVGNKLRIDLRMVEVESGVVITAAEETTDAADMAGWLSAVEQASLQLLSED